MIKALALVVGPILCGAVFFLVESPAQAPGAYMEIADGVYRLSTCAAAASSGVSTSTDAPVVPGGVRSFYLVLGDDVAASANAKSASLYLRVVDHAAPEADYGRTQLSTAVHRMNPHVYRVVSDQRLQWDSNGLTNTVYQQALSRIAGDRATSEVLLELEVPAPPAAPCRYAVVLGPPPGSSDRAVKWFVPPAEKRQ